MSHWQFCEYKGIREQPKRKMITPEVRPRALKELGSTTAKWQPVVAAISIFTDVSCKQPQVSALAGKILQTKAKNGNSHVNKYDMLKASLAVTNT